MAKLRVYEYAKQLNMSSKEIISILKRLNVPVNNHMSVLDEEAQSKVTQFFEDVKRKAQEDKMKKATEKDTRPETMKKDATVQQVDQKATQEENVQAQSHDKPKSQAQPQNRSAANRSEQQRNPRNDGERHQRSENQSRPVRQGGDNRGQKSDQNRPPRQGGEHRGQRQDFSGRPPRQGSDNRSQRQDQGARPKNQEDFRKDGGFKGQKTERGNEQRSQRERDNRMTERRSVVLPPVVAEEKSEPRRRNQPKKSKEKLLFEEKKKRNIKSMPLKPIDYENDRGEIVTGKKRNKMKKNKDVVFGDNKETPTKIAVEETITVGEFAKMIGKDPSEVIKKLLLLGVIATINQEIDIDVVTLVASEYGIEVEKKEIINEDEFETIVEHDEPDQLEERPPVVTIMGHVDHGKTTLLDSIRHTRVTAQEAGGITQHIGAYQVEINGKKITFLDTPGHEAFTAMRARGAEVTDIAVIVVAADDGVMPQTVEAINHAKAAQVPIIIAVNKMDKPTANPERVMQELTNHGLVPEEWGGDTIFVPVSALKGDGIDNLLEMILLVAEVQELKANPNKRARGTVIEAKLDKGKGPVATVLVQHGTLKIGDAVVIGTTYGRIRSMMNDLGQRISEAKPSTPVEITGLDSVPQAGDQFMVFSSDSKAKAIAERRAQKKHEQSMRKTTVTLDDLFNQIKEGEIKELNLIIKADVQGTAEALRSSLEKIQVEGVRVKIIHSGVGTITESDVILASTSNAIIIGFNVRPDANARATAELEKVDIRLHSIIYKVIEEIESALKGMLDPEYQEKVIGQVEVRQTFKVSKVGTIAGCYVTDGKVTRDSQVRIIRNGIVIYTGQIDTLKRFKDDVKEVAQGYECGITIKNYNDIQVGDVLEVFIMEEIAR